MLWSLNAVISTNESTRFITGHLIYNPAYTYNFQLKTPKVLSTEPMAKTIDSLGQLQNMKNMKIYLVKNSFVDDVISDIESLKEMESLGYKLFHSDWCSILLPKLFWPKNCWRLRICKSFEITRTIYPNIERSEEFLVAECFFNLFLEVFHI